MRMFLWIVAGLAIVLGSFYGTLFFMDNYWQNADTPAGRNAIRAQHVAQLRKALESYQKKQRLFPLLPDNPVDDLKSALVDGGYLSSIPNDPSKTTLDRQYRYVSTDGGVFGLLIKIETDTGVKPCLAGPAGRGFWADPPVCPFWKP